MSVLSEKDLKCLERDGYVVVRGAIPAEQAQRSTDEVWAFAGRPENRQYSFGIDRDDVDSWYAKTPDSRVDGRTVEMYHGKWQWSNRTSPRVYEAFRQILGDYRICCSFDAANITPPTLNPDEKLEFLHWDTWLLYSYNKESHGNNIKPKPGDRNVWEAVIGQEPAVMSRALDGRLVQGMLFLTDTPEDAGPFIIVPGFHRRIESWLKSLPPTAIPSQEDLLGMGTVKVTGRAGDLVIWNSLCPHSGGVNNNKEGKVRVVQYILYNYSKDQSYEARRWRIEFHRDGQPGNGNRHGMPNEKGGVELTPLGRKMAGLDPWESNPAEQT